MIRLSRLFNFKGELFSSTFTYAMSALIRLGSSLVLTRLLNPEAYGVVAILSSVAFVLELISDVGTVALLVRHPRGGEPQFIHTLWTIRFLRSAMNFGLLYAFAPRIATLYETPFLAEPLRDYSFTFLLAGLQSMSFLLAQRDQRSRIFNYAELVTNAAMTVSVVLLAWALRDYYAFVYGALVQRALLSLASLLYYRDVGVSFAWDREAVRDQFKFARVVLPSSLLTIALSQYDRVILLKLFDLALLGLYGLAAGIIAPVAGLTSKNSRVVLYARCAEYVRADPSSVVQRYYGENTKLMRLGVLFPALVAGFAPAIVGTLYDSRYAEAGPILMLMALATVLGGFENPAENLLVAAGRTHVVLMANAIRVVVLPISTLLGYHFFGFNGFLVGTLIPPMAVTAYCFYEQYKLRLLIPRIERRRLLEAVIAFGVACALSRVWLHFVPAGDLLGVLKRTFVR